MWPPPATGTFPHSFKQLEHYIFYGLVATIPNEVPILGAETRVLIHPLLLLITGVYIQSLWATHEFVFLHLSTKLSLKQPIIDHLSNERIYGWRSFY